ncbi:hypothetical protein MLD38_012859 [Melastoma candidum]|uniref:Uncharacterized protein n=1 Tax=Melastoma candidum TaxID=119954 RepID=A0ACB9R7P0_9MYRT|nr:hypothetical protein MLD38_012859 [Melastoma candidum]
MALASSSSASVLSFSAAGTSSRHCGWSTIGDSVRFRPMSVSASCATTAERPPPRTFSSHHIASPGSLYEVLGIGRGATFQEIKAAYRKLARVLHPDVAASSDGMGREFMRVHEAYETLSDPDKRADYDRLMLVGRHPSPVRAGPVYGCRTRKWETDQCW